MNTAQDLFYNVKDVMRILDYSKSKAYKVIATLNKELEEKGYITRRGYVIKRYFNRRYGIEPAEKNRL